MGQAVTDGDSLEQELCLKIAENKQKTQTNLMSDSPGNGVRVADRVSHVGANCSSQIRAEAEAEAGTEAVPSSAQLSSGGRGPSWVPKMVRSMRKLIESYQSTHSEQ